MAQCPKCGGSVKSNRCDHCGRLPPGPRRATAKAGTFEGDARAFLKSVYEDQTQRLSVRLYAAQVADINPRRIN